MKFEQTRDFTIDRRTEPHPLLAQVPMTVSPFISLPTATTLPYTYKPLPSTLPPSSTADANGVERKNYVVSASGHAASPEDIIASSQALQAHIEKSQDDAKKAIEEWESSLRAEELAERRRLAPGWLDRTEKILEPEKKGANISKPKPSQTANRPASIVDSQDDIEEVKTEEQCVQDAAGDELDRAFGSIGLR